MQTVFGTVRLHITATPVGTGRQIFIGIGPAAAVDRYLSGVSRPEIPAHDAPASTSTADP